MNSVLLTETTALLTHQPPPLGIRRCPGPLPSEKARWPRESTISFSPRCERCRYHARLHPLHRGFHCVCTPGYGELAVTDGFVAGGAASRMGRRACPASVRRYSWRGGRCEYCRRSITPVCSSLRSRAVSTSRCPGAHGDVLKAGVSVANLAGHQQCRAVAPRANADPVGHHRCSSLMQRRSA
jgi:hypothetical protein